MTKAFVIDTISKKSTAFSMILGFGKVSAGSERLELFRVIEVNQSSLNSIDGGLQCSQHSL